MLLLLTACAGNDDLSRDVVAPTATGDTGPFGATGDTGTAAVDGCARDPLNALRAWCSFATAATADLRVELTRADGTDPRTFLPDPALGDGVLLWNLEPSTTWSWRLLDEGAGIDLTGELTTGRLPMLAEDVAITVTTSSPESQLETFLFSPTCPTGYAFMADADGDVVWYQSLHEGASGFGAASAVQWTEDRTVLVHTGRDGVREFDLAGNVLLDLERGVDFDDYVHHDLFRKDGLTYDLRAREATVEADAVIVDGIYVFDAAGALVAELDMEGLWPYAVQPIMEEGYWASMFPDAIDFSHANSVFLDPAGDILVSFRHLSAFAKFRGGPGTPGFGDLLWTAVGDPSSAIVSVQEFTLAGPDDPYFQGQHDVNLLPDGTLVLLDNGYPLEQTARAVRYALDESARTLTLLEAWDTGQSCPVLGGARPLPGGNLLVTCDSTGTIFEFAPGVAEPVWQAHIGCEFFFGSQVPRAIPVPRQ